VFEEIREAVRRIPYGKVSTYGEVARAAGHPKAARRVAWALKQTGDSLPWFRVLGAGGKISLPGASGMEQRLRLEAEGVQFRGRNVRMDLHGYWFRRVVRKAGNGSASDRKTS
jgi:methylated-DNA-protein-cysteine methyltransferase-like protein